MLWGYCIVYYQASILELSKNRYICRPFDKSKENITFMISHAPWFMFISSRIYSFICRFAVEKSRWSIFGAPWLCLNDEMDLSQSSLQHPTCFLAQMWTIQVQFTSLMLNNVIFASVIVLVSSFLLGYKWISCPSAC